MQVSTANAFFGDLSGELTCDPARPQDLAQRLKAECQAALKELVLRSLTAWKDISLDDHYHVP